MFNIIGNLATPIKRAKKAATFVAVAGPSHDPTSPITSTNTRSQIANIGFAQLSSPAKFGFEEVEEDEVLPEPRHRRRQRVNYAVSIFKDITYLHVIHKYIIMYFSNIFVFQEIDANEMHFEREHMEEMRQQTEQLRQQTDIMRAILAIKEEKWTYEKSRRVGQ